MQFPTFSKMQALHVSGLETVRRLRAINTRVFDRLAQQQLETLELCVDAGIKQLRLLGQAQGPYDLFAGQAQLAQEYVERVVEHARQSVQALVSAQNEVAWASGVPSERASNPPTSAETVSTTVQVTALPKKAKP